MTVLCTTPGISVATVLICDERPAARRELTILLTSGAAPARVTATGDGPGMVQEFRTARADVVMIGVHYGSHNGTTALNLLLNTHPGAHVIVYGGVQDSGPLASAVAGGARGLMIWDVGQRLTRMPLPGARPPRGTDAGSAPRNTALPLTDREIQILHGMSLGRSNGAIGRELYISEDTVKTHARRLFDKIGAVDRAHAVALGLRTGLL